MREPSEIELSTILIFLLFPWYVYYPGPEYELASVAPLLHLSVGVSIAVLVHHYLGARMKMFTLLILIPIIWEVIEPSILYPSRPDPWCDPYYLWDTIVDLSLTYLGIVIGVKVGSYELWKTGT